MPMSWHPKNRALEIARDVKALLSGKSRDRQKLERERQERLSKLHAVRASRDRAERVKLKREKIRQKQAAIGS